MALGIVIVRTDIIYLVFPMMCLSISINEPSDNATDTSDNKYYYKLHLCN